MARNERGLKWAQNNTNNTRKYAGETVGKYRGTLGNAWKWVDTNGSRRTCMKLFGINGCTYMGVG